MFLLGACDDHPSYPGRSYTIPVIEGGRLVNLRLRLDHPEKPGDKYRPYRPGYGSQLFNAGAIRATTATVLVTAGEKKAIVLWSKGYTAVSPTNGCSGWQDAWTAKLAHVPVVDPSSIRPRLKRPRSWPGAWGGRPSSWTCPISRTISSCSTAERLLPAVSKGEEGGNLMPNRILKESITTSESLARLTGRRRCSGSPPGHRG